MSDLTTVRELFSSKKYSDIIELFSTQNIKSSDELNTKDNFFSFFLLQKSIRLKFLSTCKDDEFKVLPKYENYKEKTVHERRKIKLDFEEHITNMEEDFKRLKETSVNALQENAQTLLEVMLISATRHSFILLKDNRKLSFQWYGCADENNVKHVILLHGTPGSRAFCPMSWDLFATKHKVRIHVLDRPGYGLSDYNPDRTLANFSNDIEEYCDYFSLSEIYILGYSAGAPTAALCSATMRCTLVKGIACVAAIYPSQGATRGMSCMNKIAWNCILKNRFLTTAAVKLDVRGASKDPITACANTFLNTKSKSDKLLFRQNSEIVDTFVASFIVQHNLLASPNLTATSTAEAQDYLLFRNKMNWSELTAQQHFYKESSIPVLIYSGELDSGASPDMGKELASIIPNSKYKCFKGKGHLFIFSHFDRILLDLIN